MVRNVEAGMIAMLLSTFYKSYSELSCLRVLSAAQPNVNPLPTSFVAEFDPGTDPSKTTEAESNRHKCGIIF